MKITYTRNRREDGWAATTTAIVMAIVAAATSAAGAITAGQAQKSAAKFNAKVASNNALMAQQQAAADAALVQKRNVRLRGTQIAALSAAGLDPNSDSAQSVMYDSAVSGELDKLTTLYKGRVQGVNYTSQAEGDIMAGNSASTAGYVSAGSSLLSGAAQASSQYARSRSNPTFDNADWNATTTSKDPFTSGKF